MKYKYEFTGETKTVLGYTLRRIRAVRDIPRHNVSAGDLGGWIEEEANLCHDFSAWVGGNACVFGKAWVTGDAIVDGEAQVFWGACVGNSAHVYENAEIFDNAVVGGQSEVFGHAHIRGKAHIDDFAKVCDYVTVDERSFVSDSALICGNALICGSARVSGDAVIGGLATIDGKAEVKSTDHVLVIHPLGEEADALTAFVTSDGIRIAHYDFRGPLDRFSGEFNSEEYQAAIKLIRARMMALVNK